MKFCDKCKIFEPWNKLSGNFRKIQKLILLIQPYRWLLSCTQDQSPLKNWFEIFLQLDKLRTGEKYCISNAKELVSGCKLIWGGVVTFYICATFNIQRYCNFHVLRMSSCKLRLTSKKRSKLSGARSSFRINKSNFELTSVQSILFIRQDVK